MSEKKKHLPKPKKAKGNDFSLGITLQFVNTFSSSTPAKLADIPEPMGTVLKELEKRQWIIMRVQQSDSFVPRLTDLGAAALARFTANGHFRK